VSDRPLYDQVVAEIPRLRRFARNLIGSADRADDLVQDALIRAVESIDSFRSGSNLRAWLFAILRNVFIDQRRREVRAPFEDAGADGPPEVWVAPNQERQAELDDLAAAIARMPDGMRQVVLLCGVEGLDYEEVAEILGIPVGTVRSRLSRAREMLKQDY
jgi:RNA polymerase sigma-70 factor (ECF subfamily)